MDREAELSEAFYNVIKRVNRGGVVVEAVVLSVDETKFTCDVTVKDSANQTPTTHFDVPLRVLVSNQASVVEIPEIGTECIICFRDSNIGRPQILMVHKALKILVLCDQVVFNNGTLGGMIILDDAVNRWNKIEQDINNLKAVFSSWTPVPNDGGAALKTAAASWYGQQLTITQPSDVENPKIKQ
jgi:hypothetical protein